MFMSMIYTTEEKKSTGIYAIINTLNDKCYIGSTTLSFMYRWTKHLYDLNRNKHHSPYLQRSWNINGSSNFEFKILEVVPEIEFIDNKYLTDIEQMYMDTYNPEYNVSPTAGSRKGQIWSAESRLKVSLRVSGSGNPMYGKKRTFSEEHRKKISLKNSGQNNGMYGKPGSKCRCKDYTVTNPEGIIFNVKGLSEFCKEHKLDASSMVKVAKGKIKHHKNWLCAYLSTQNTPIELPV